MYFQMLLEKLNGTVPFLLDKTTVAPLDDESTGEQCMLILQCFEAACKIKINVIFWIKRKAPLSILVTKYPSDV